ESLELKTLQLELVNAANDLQLSEKILQELEPSSRRGVVSAQHLLDAQVKRQQHRNALEIARSKWRSLGLPETALEQLLRDRDLGRPLTLPVTSPVGGVVIHTDLPVGKVVEPAEHLFEVVGLSTVWVQIGVLERDLARVMPGQPVELSLTAYPGEL